MKRLLPILALFLAAFTAPAAEWHFAWAGDSVNGDGSIENPWGWEALNQAAWSEGANTVAARIKGAVAAGDTLSLHGRGCTHGHSQAVWDFPIRHYDPISMTLTSDWTAPADNATAQAFVNNTTNVESGDILAIGDNLVTARGPITGTSLYLENTYENRGGIAETTVIGSGTVITNGAGGAYSDMINFGYAGTEESKIILQAYPGETVIIEGGINFEHLSSAFVTVKRLITYSPNMDRVGDDNADMFLARAGFYSAAYGIDFIECESYGGGAAGAFFNNNRTSGSPPLGITTTNYWNMSVAAGYYGYNGDFDRGGGFYTQNKAGNFAVTENHFSWHNLSSGAKIWGQDVEASGLSLINSVGIDDYFHVGAQDNALGLLDSVMTGNYVYLKFLSTRTTGEESAFELGFTNGADTNNVGLTFVGNIGINGRRGMDMNVQWHNVNIKSNLFSRAGQSLFFGTRNNQWTEVEIDHNQWHRNAALFGSDPFEVSSGKVNFASWQGLGHDANGSFSTSNPSGLIVRVVTNRFTPNRFRVDFVNFATSTPTLDWTEYLPVSAGQTLRVYDLQNYRDLTTTGFPRIELTNMVVAAEGNLVDLRSTNFYAIRDVLWSSTDIDSPPGGKQQNFKHSNSDEMGRFNSWIVDVGSDRRLNVQTLRVNTIRFE